MSKKYIALRKARRSHGEEKRLQVIATTSLERLTEEIRKYTTQPNTGKVLEISDKRGILEMLDELSIKSGKSPLMKEIRAQFESEDEYEKEWAPYGYTEEWEPKTQNCGFLNFPIRGETFVKGLLYGYFDVKKTIALPTEPISSE